MLFEIYNRENKRVMCTDSAACIPDKDTLAMMSKQSGYTFKYNGRKTSQKALQEVLNNKQ